jgi:mono/diheme cytochrome c family protein
MKTFLSGFIAAFVLLPLIAIGYFSLGLAQTASDIAPPAWESHLMNSAVHASVRRSAREIQTPPSGNVEETMIEGGKLYFNGCMGCHGEPGKFQEDRSNYPPVPQLAQVGTQYSEPEIYWIAKHGIRNTAMSAYGPFYTDKQMWALATFLRRIDHLPPDVLEQIRAKKISGGS